MKSFMLLSVIVMAFEVSASDKKEIYEKIVYNDPQIELLESAAAGNEAKAVSAVPNELRRYCLIAGDKCKDEKFKKKAAVELSKLAHKRELKSSDLMAEALDEVKNIATKCDEKSKAIFDASTRPNHKCQQKVVCKGSDGKKMMSLLTKAFNKKMGSSSPMPVHAINNIDISPMKDMFEVTSLGAFGFGMGNDDGIYIMKSSVPESIMVLRGAECKNDECSLVFSQWANLPENEKDYKACVESPLDILKRVTVGKKGKSHINNSQLIKDTGSNKESNKIKPSVNKQ